MQPAIYLHTAAGGTRALSVQAARCVEYLRSKGIQAYTTYEDEGRDRSARDQMLKQMQAGKHDLVIVHGLDRVARNIDELRDIVDRIDLAGAVLHSTLQGDVGAPDLRPLLAAMRATVQHDPPEGNPRAALARR
jgi:DNA invertase Pin-like site-specific DNA recombinase